jgi:hypothetical protein
MPAPNDVAGKTVMSHTRRVDKLLIRPTHDNRVRRRQHERTSLIQGTINGPISFWVTYLPPAPVSDVASRNRRNQTHSQVSRAVDTGDAEHRDQSPRGHP